MLRHPCLLAALVVGCGSAAGPANEWPAKARRDLEALRATIEADHPGAVDALNPGFRAWLEAGYVEALALAAAVHDQAGYAAVVRRYVAGFRDGHLSVWIETGPARWPGFAVRLRDGAYTVSATSVGGPPLGATLVSCDGRAPADRMRADVFPYAGDPQLEAHWVRFAPTLLLDTGNPFVAPPARCTLAVGGAPRELALAWRPLEPEQLDAIKRSGFGAPLPTGVRELPGGLVWIALPSFATSAGADEVVRRAPAIRAASRIVFDVRGNGGGSSMHGTTIANAIWGQPYVEAMVHRSAAGKSPSVPPVVIEWRASPVVQHHVEQLVLLVPALADYLKKIAAGIAEARAAGRPLYAERDDDQAPAPAVLPEPATRARAIFLTDGVCASACLDFADLLLRAIPGVVHAGQPTSADTQYMEVRRMALPSGAMLSIATKVWRNRPRGNEPYVPAVRVPAAVDETSTPALEAWLGAL